MNTNYPVGDFLIRVKNSAMAGNKKMSAPLTKQVAAAASALSKAGFLDAVKKEKNTIEVSLAFRDKKPVIMNITLITKPGRRIYLKASEIAKKRGPSQYLISTPGGILMSKEAVKKNQGGEIIAEIW